MRQLQPLRFRRDDDFGAGNEFSDFFAAMFGQSLRPVLIEKTDLYPAAYRKNRQIVFETFYVKFIIIHTSPDKEVPENRVSGTYIS